MVVSLTGFLYAIGSVDSDQMRVCVAKCCCSALFRMLLLLIVALKDCQIPFVHTWQIKGLLLLPVSETSWFLCLLGSGLSSSSSSLMG